MPSLVVTPTAFAPSMITLRHARIAAQLAVPLDETSDERVDQAAGAALHDREADVLRERREHPAVQRAGQRVHREVGVGMLPPSSN